MNIVYNNPQKPTISKQRIQQVSEVMFQQRRHAIKFGVEFGVLGVYQALHAPRVYLLLQLLGNAAVARDPVNPLGSQPLFLDNVTADFNQVRHHLLDKKRY